jgi:hypothetical protein
MTDVKVYDWVWCDDGEPHIVLDVFKSGVLVGPGGEFFENRDYTVLEPYASKNEVRVGDRCVVLVDWPDHANLKAGQIVVVEHLNYLKFTRVTGGWVVDGEYLAPLPRDEKSAVAKNATTENPTPNPLPIPCPHPELLGIWDFVGKGFHVEWVDYRFVATSDWKDNHGNCSISRMDPWELSDGWTPIERAPDCAIAYPAQRRTGDKDKARHDYIKVPVDPYGEG